MNNNKEQSFPTYYLLGILSEMRIDTYSKTLFKEALQYHKPMGMLWTRNILWLSHETGTPKNGRSLQ